MAEGDGKTVLVTGGTGYLAGWCIVELLRRGYRVRTTVRKASREHEVHEAIDSEVDSHHNLTVHQADLLSDEHWDHVIDGCDYVLHVASPLPVSQPKDPEELIVPAREGTRRVVSRALDAGVERVVLTSSVAAIRGGNEGRALDETIWTDLSSPDLTPYVQSKTIAEQTAWGLADERDARERVATVNPTVIIGPVLSDDTSASLEVIQRLLKGMPAMPRLGFGLVDVRDVADLEIRAMTAPEAGGERFVANAQWLWMSEIAEVLRERLGARASKVPTRIAPDLLVQVMAIFDGGIRSFKNQLGVRTEYGTTKAHDVLGWSPRPVEDTITESAESLIEHDIVKAPASA
jgi:nucleoside-diphosphate-sugar epimerase